MWSGIGCSVGITLDLTPPTTPIVTDDGQFTLHSSSLHARWSTSDPDTGVVLYEYCIGTSPTACDVLASRTTDAAEVQVTGLSLQNGQSYYFSVRAKNGAGLWSDWGRSDGIKFDSTPPTDPVVLDDGQYTTDPSCIRASWSSSDPESNVVEYSYAVGTACGGTDLINWTSAGGSTSANICGFSLRSGTTYFVSVKAKNGAGLWSLAGCSDGIEVDLTPPGTPVVTDDGQYTSNATALHALFQSADAESGVALYEYCIGTSPSTCDVLTSSTTDAAEVQVTGLSLQNGQSYYFSVRAKNGAGLWSDWGRSDGIGLDTTPPSKPVVVDDGEYTSSPDKICAHWSSSDPESGIAGYSYAIGTSTDNADMVPWTSCGPQTSICRTGLPLADGITYYVCVKAVNGAGSESEAGCSDGIRVDATPPSKPTVVDDGLFTTETTALHASWSSEDLQTGVAEYQCAIGKTPGADDVLSWRSEGLATDFRFAGLSLQGGTTYYINVRARNGIGLWSDTGSSDGIVVETTPPTRPVVTDEGEYALANDSLFCQWSSSDPESGIAEYTYAIGTYAGGLDVVGWTSAGTNTSVTATNLSLSNHEVYYFAVKVRNGAGMWSDVGVSDGVRARSTIPAWGKFRADIGNTGVSRYLGCQSSHLAWQFTTAGWADSSPAVLLEGTIFVGSGDGFLYCIDKNGILRWKAQTNGSVDSSPALGHDDTMYVGSYDKRLYAINTAGVVRWYFYTLGPIVSSPTVAADETIYVGSVDGRVYAVRSNGTLKWYVTTGGSVTSSPAIAADGGICIGSGDGKLYMISTTGAVRWRYQTGSSITASPAIGPDGTIYVGSGDGYFYAISPAGGKIWSYFAGGVFESSAAIDGDGNVYVATSVDWSQIGYVYSFTSQGQLRWRAPLSGGSGSSPAIGSDGTIYIGAADYNLYAFDKNGNLRWSAATSGVIRSSPAIGKDGSIYVGSGDGGIYCFRDLPGADTTTPTTPLVNDDGQFTAVLSSLHASWSSMDPESGVAEYTYAIGTTPGADDVVRWTSTGNVTSVTRAGLSLTVGQTYYFAVRAKNGFGLWSAAGVSDGIVATRGQGVDRIGQAKTLNDGVNIYLHEKAVVAVFDGKFYLEELDRSAGIAVASNEVVGVGDVVSVIGDLATGIGERVINASWVNRVRSLGEPVGPLSVPNAAVCKRSCMPRSSPLALAAGLENTAMLVRTTGRVLATGDTWFTVEDGSLLKEAEGHSGLLVRCGSITKPAKDSYVSVTGIACVELAGMSPIRSLRVRTDGDIESLGP